MGVLEATDLQCYIDFPTGGHPGHPRRGGDEQVRYLGFRQLEVSATFRGGYSGAHL